MEYDIPGGYRFRVYGTGINKGYLGCFVGEHADDVVFWLREEFGGGTYHLKLIDESGRMTGYNFAARMEGPSGEEKQERLEKVSNYKWMKGLVKGMTSN